MKDKGEVATAQSLLASLSIFVSLDYVPSLENDYLPFGSKYKVLYPYRVYTGKWTVEYSRLFAL